MELLPTLRSEDGGNGMISYFDLASYCPYCGAEIGEWNGNGESFCRSCGKKFVVMEAE